MVQEYQKDDESSVNSADEALFEMLGILPSLAIGNGVPDEEDDENSMNDKGGAQALSLDRFVQRKDDNWIRKVLANSDNINLRHQYETTSVCVFPEALRIPAIEMRRLADELVWGGHIYPSDKTYETLRISKDGSTEERRALTRIENFVNYHSGWNALCNDYLRRLVSLALGQPMVLYKEKLNLKPPGGSGFAPHLDTPSLRVALGDRGPREFCTVMVAIDNMTTRNGCLRIAKGVWSEDHHVNTIQPKAEGNPDADGRAGAVLPELVDQLQFEDLVCVGGTIVAFNGWAPHRSKTNLSSFARRAVFLTYTLAAEGDFHDAYYQEMEHLRNKWRDKVGLPTQISNDELMELNALSTVPRT
jgi:ectoine hydroxylase-related dioxygenase (phytanoyl-CoA dioxygenase family)